MIDPTELHECRMCSSLRADKDGYCDRCRPHTHQWKRGHTRWGSPYEVCTICGTSHLL